MSTQHTAPRQNPWWVWLLILLLAIVFGYAGLIKLQDVSEFSHIIARFDLLPSALINPVALILPVVEILLAVTLLFSTLQRPALLGVIICNIMFAGVLVTAILRVIPVSCGCFSLTEKPSLHAAWWALGRDTILLGVAILLYLRRYWQSAEGN